MNSTFDYGDDCLRGIIGRSFRAEIESVESTMRAMGLGAFREAVRALSSAARIAAVGCGHSGIACMHLAHLMCCAERPARFIAPSEAAHGGCGFLLGGDVAVFASRGGGTDELPPLMRLLKGRGVTLLAVTENPSSEMAGLADITLPIKVTRECDAHDSQGTSSFVAMCAVFDALQAAVIDATGFDPERFAGIHPGGAVGRRLGGAMGHPVVLGGSSRGTLGEDHES